MNVDSSLRWLVKQVEETALAVEHALSGSEGDMARALSEVAICTAHSGHVRWVAALATKKERTTRGALSTAGALIEEARTLHRELFRVYLSPSRSLAERELARGLTTAALLLRQAAQEGFPEAWKASAPALDDERIWSVEQYSPLEWPYGGLADRYVRVNGVLQRAPAASV